MVTRPATPNHESPPWKRLEPRRGHGRLRARVAAEAAPTASALITPAKSHRRAHAFKPARTLGAPHPSAARPRKRPQRCVLPIDRAALGCGAPGGRN
jgi:hypothetical protein